MKSLFSLLFIFTVCLSGFSQSSEKQQVVKTDHSSQKWYLDYLKEVPNYLEVRAGYDAYFEQHPYEKSLQKNTVRRWIATMASQQDEEGNVVPYHMTTDDYNKVSEADKYALMKYKSQPKERPNSQRTMMMPPNTGWNDSVGTWRMIGPYHARLTGGHRMHGGFNDRVYINPLNAQNMYAGQSYGGLWVTQDGGATWKLSDANLPNGKNTYANRDMYYGEIEVHPSNANRVVVGSEAGVMISNDAGRSWNLADSMNYIKKPTERSYFIAQKPDDQNTILCSYGKQIFRSINGGTTWTLVFDNNAVSHILGTGQHSTIGVFNRWYNIVGLEFNPVNPNVVILSALNSAKQVCIYKSINAGQSFTLVANTGNTKWLKMITTPADPGHIYLANIMTDFKTPATGEGIYKYDTSGVSISYTPYPGNNDAALLDDIMVSQTDVNHWAAGGYATGNVMVSTNAGATWVSHNATNGTFVHSDVRSFSMVGDVMLVGTDGGLHLSQDKGVHFAPGSHWISAIDLWGFGSAFKGDLIGAGDDHGPTELRITDTDQAWHAIGGADSHEIHINQCDQNFAYGADVYSPFRGDKINDTTFVRSGNAIPRTDYKYLAQDPDECYKFYPVYQSTLRYSKDNLSTNTILRTFSNEVTKVEVVLKNNQILYILENNRTVYKSIDGGLTYNVITPPSSVTAGRLVISDIETDEYGNNVWLAYGQNQTSCKVVYSSDGGSSWTNITGTNMPNNAAEHITYQRGTNGVVYVGLKPGSVWYKGLTDATWSMLGSGLPMMGYITTMYTVPDRNKFRMGTSRGAFEHDLPRTSNVLAHFSVSSKETVACPYDTVQFFDYSSYSGTNATFLWTFEGGSPATTTLMNPKVTYTVSGKYDVTLIVTDGSGNSSTYAKTDFISASYDEGCGPKGNPTFAMYNTVQDKFLTAPAATLTGTRNYTMMAWVKGEGSQVDYAGILSQKLSNGAIHLNVRDFGADSTQIGYHHPNGAWWWSSGLYLHPNQWTHLAIVVEPTGITIYKNGVGVKHNITVASSDFVEKFVAGSMIGAEYYRTFSGFIDEVAVYKRSLSADEVRRLMHITKENPKYPDQHDVDLIAYYQFNRNALKVNDVSGNGKNATLSGGVSLIASDGPYGGGRSEIINVTSAGLYNFTSPGVKLQFGSTHPNGKLSVSHIENKPNRSTSSGVLHEQGYYIINNYGLNKTFSPMVSMSFDKTGTVSQSVATNGANFNIWKRPSFSHQDGFVSVINSNISAQPGNDGIVTATNANPITSFSQFVITRDPYPMAHARVKMVSDVMKDVEIEGGESVSLWVDSDNQGFGMPIINDAELNSLGAPMEGMICYHTTSKAIHVFSNGTWKKLVSSGILDITAGSAIATSGISYGTPSVMSSDAVLKIREKGFIQLASMDSMGLTNIKYPTKGLLVYNSQSKYIQMFDGSRWSNLDLTNSNLPVSIQPAALKKHMIVGTGSSAANVVLHDSETTGGVLFPTLPAESVASPTEGLLIFDTSRGRLMFYDGSIWNLIGG